MSSIQDTDGSSEADNYVTIAAALRTELDELKITTDKSKAIFVSWVSLISATTRICNYIGCSIDPGRFG